MTRTLLIVLAMAGAASAEPIGWSGKISGGTDLGPYTEQSLDLVLELARVPEFEIDGIEPETVLSITRHTADAIGFPFAEFEAGLELRLHDNADFFHFNPIASYLNFVYGFDVFTLQSIYDLTGGELIDRLQLPYQATTLPFRLDEFRLSYIANPNQPGYNALFWEIQGHAVPEPGSLAVALTGFGLLALRRHGASMKKSLFDVSLPTISWASS